jgi:GDP-4-dehydro-6-deoxy-D-mannose reductase
LVYGEAHDPDHAHDESCPLQPASPYAVSKAAADLLSFQATCHPGLDIVRARPFNHAGPRQSPDYAVASFARHIAAIENGRQPTVIETGNLESRRDLTDVRDTVRAYQLIMDKGATGEVYNIATGVSPSMQSVLDRLLSMTRVPIRVQSTAGARRPADTRVVRGDASKLCRATGWKPALTLEQTLLDTLEFWRRNS